MIQVYVTKHDYGFCTDIYFVQRDLSCGIERVALPMKLEWKDLDKNCIEPQSPSLRIESRLAEELLRALAEALDKEGVKTENDYKIAGVLEATKKHLDDMRTLVLKKEKK